MLIEFITATIIAGIAILFLNPGHLSMPENVQSMLTIGLILAFIAFAAFILKEKSSDERETLHILAAGRISYLIGVGTLITAIIIQASHHEIDPWLVLTLCSMVFTKITSRIYSRFKM